MKKRTIITSNEEIYKKLNQLHFSSEVVIDTATKLQMNKILTSLNRDGKKVSMEKVKDSFKLKKNGKLNFNFYLSKKK